MPDRGDRRDTVQAVDRSARVLEIIAASDLPMSALEVAARAGLNRTVTHRLLHTLAEAGLVRQTQRRYLLGDACAHLDYAYLDGLPFRRPALLYGTDLAIRFADRPWMVSLATPVRDYVMIIDRIWEPKTPLYTILDIGTRLEFDGSALGRTMLAAMAAADAVRLIGQSRWDSVAPRLAAIREDGGVDTSVDEVQRGITAIASVVRWPGASGPAGAIAIAGPSEDRELAESQEVLRQIQLAARNVERALPGFSLVKPGRVP